MHDSGLGPDVEDVAHARAKLVELVDGARTLMTEERPISRRVNPTTNSLTLGQRIKELRLEVGYSQAQLAELLDVHVSSIRNWEHGTAITTDRLIDLCRALTTSPSALLSFEDPDDVYEKGVDAGYRQGFEQAVFAIKEVISEVALENLKS